MDYYPYNYVPNDALSNPFSLESYYTNNKQFVRNMSTPYLQSYPYSAFGNVDYYYPDNYYNEPNYDYGYPSYMGNQQGPNLYYQQLPSLNPFLYQFNPLDVEYLKYVHNKGKKEGMKLTKKINNESDLNKTIKLNKKMSINTIKLSTTEEPVNNMHKVNEREKRILLKVKQLDDKGLDIEEIMDKSLKEKKQHKYKNKLYSSSKAINKNISLDNNRYSGLPNIENRMKFNNVIHNEEKEENEKNIDKLGSYQMKYSYGFRIARVDKSVYIKPSSNVLEDKKENYQNKQVHSMNNSIIQIEKLKNDLKGDSNTKFPNINTHKYTKQDYNESNVNYESTDKEIETNEKEEQIETKMLPNKKKKVTKKQPKQEETNDNNSRNTNSKNNNGETKKYFEMKEDSHNNKETIDNVENKKLVNRKKTGGKKIKKMILKTKENENTTNSEFKDYEESVSNNKDTFKKRNTQNKTTTQKQDNPKLNENNETNETKTKVLKKKVNKKRVTNND
jgi:hypothetical protein